ncbi:zinc finger protein CONSTANS-LIKE 9 [Tripterygium wilfordii]|uniref:zinc finger protein CONSTANS-LIKE 9 n=1 Tax=Tripterygium wilfordii TaxID=458696 RepID=UPI0018F7E8BA|nr:zinc finger protein CONSTANS-LIKE 9 [Tripterygium wilfordii]
MKGCELCGRAARMYCESDSASLCWDCDEKVHGANFLVAKHCRTLLCQVCQSSTPWKASGSKLGQAVSVCESCIVNKNRREREGSSEGTGESQRPSDPESADEDDETDESDFDHSDEEDEEEEDEDGENQVVPWSDETPPPPAVVSSSSSEGDISSGFVGNGSGMKRRRDKTDLDAEDELGYSSSQEGYGGESGQLQCKSTAIMKRIRRDEVTGGDSTSETVVRICGMSRDQGR